MLNKITSIASYNKQTLLAPLADEQKNKVQAIY
jgi:hypothetical protein